jgi:hypothetical protein
LLAALNTVEANSRYSRPWYDGVDLIDPALVSGQQYSLPKKGKKRAKK